MKSLLRILAVLVLAGAPALTMAVSATPVQAQARHHWARGEVLPDWVLRAGPNVSYAAQRLRRPPEGCGWFALDGDFLLASLSSGLILEVVDN
ncbi:MAG TPA: RcnB family protein [Caulobacteraceae bacterium]|nr:RcnB family protein [Caulobacteraceae bacterium]